LFTFLYQSDSFLVHAVDDDASVARVCKLRLRVRPEELTNSLAFTSEDTDREDEQLSVALRTKSAVPRRVYPFERWHQADQGAGGHSHVSLVAQGDFQTALH
jgi:hypothetical protein